MSKTPKAEIIAKPIEKISGKLKKNAWGAIAESLITIILGIFLITWSNTVIRVVACIAGAFFVIKGAYQIINYLVVKGQNDFFNNELLSGVISLLVGLALLVIGEEIVNIFRIVIGIWMIYESLIRMNTSLKLHAAGIKAWSYVLIIALCMLVVGVFITFNSGAVVELIGWMMILSGVFGIVGDVVFIQYVNNIADTLTGKAKSKK